MPIVVKPGVLGNLGQHVVVATPTNYIDDLVPVTHEGKTKYVDFGTDDTLTGTDSRDVITVHDGNDTVHAAGGNDVMIDLAGGNDTFFGGAGHDTFVLGRGNDVADGGSGIDTADYTNIDFTLVADLKVGFAFADGIDQLISIENVRATKWNDTVRGDSSNNTFWGLAGNDKLVGGAGKDTLFGGSGDDKMWGDDDSLTLRLPHDDKLFGEAGKDTLAGGGGNDLLDGGTEDDVLNGGSGNDTLIGGRGIDTMTGGADADIFVIKSLSDVSRYDKITDFKRGVDKIDVSAIDARPDIAGNQAFKMARYTSATEDGASVHPGPIVDGDTGFIEKRYANGKTYVYLETHDGNTGAHLVLNGHVALTADDFIL